MNKKEKTLYIIAGANGSGKSTLASVLLKEKKLEFLNADEIAKEISPEAIDKVPITAGKEYFKKLKEFFDKEKSFAIETTLSGKNILKIITKAKSLNYKIILVYSFLESCTVCINRVKNRVANGGHNVPEVDIIRRYYKSIVKFNDEYKNQVDEWTLFFNGLDYCPQVVAYGVKENHDIIDTKLYKFFEEIYRLSKKELKIND